MPVVDEATGLDAGFVCAECATQLEMESEAEVGVKGDA